jgi:hypothetical protein
MMMFIGIILGIYLVLMWGGAMLASLIVKGGIDWKEVLLTPITFWVG